MNYRTIRWTLTACCMVVFLTGVIDQTTKNAQKVQHILKKIETHPPRKNKKRLAAVVSQKEVNAYIKYLLAQEKNSPVNSLRVALLSKNKVQGRLRSDAKELNLGLFFGDLLDIDFIGTLQAKNGKARIHLSAVELNGLPVAPGFLDTIIDAAARCNGTAAGSINDWYALPKGVQSIFVNKGKAVLYY